MNAHVQHLSIPRPPGAESAEQARAFYGGLLGFEEAPVPKSLRHIDLVWFRVGGLELHCYAQEPINDPMGRHFCLQVDDLEAMRARLLEAGYTPRDTIPIPGRPRFFCPDPFGNVIEYTTIVGDYLEIETTDD